MDWEQLAPNFGFAGLMLLVIGYVAKLWIASNERVQLEQVKVEDKKTDVEAKKADAMVSALTTLSGKIDAHQVADIQSHQDMATGIARLESKIDTIADFTPVSPGPSQPPRRASTPAQGTASGGSDYVFTRPKTQGGR